MKIGNEIASTPKSIYKKKIKDLMNKAVFEYLLNEKRAHTKLNDVTYQSFKLQPYLATKTLNNKSKELLYNLRSKCHSSKNNFRKMNRNNLYCIFKCHQIEDQIHSFSHCPHSLKGIDGADTAVYESIFGTLSEQVEVMTIFSKIENRRNHMKKYHFLPGGRKCQDPCTFGFTSVGAADTLYICT